MLGIGLVFNLVLVIAPCALVRVRNRFGLQYSIPNNTIRVRVRVRVRAPNCDQFEIMVSHL